MKVNGFLLLSLLVLILVLSLPGAVSGQDDDPGCGCYMPPTLGTEPASPTPTAWATLAPPPLPDKPVRPPTFLPLVGGA